MMPLFSSIGKLINNVTPFRKKTATVIPPSPGTANEPQTPVEHIRPSSSTFGGLVTPATTTQPSKRKRQPHSLSPERSTGSHGLLTPPSSVEVGTDSPTRRPRKRARVSVESSPIQSIEHDHVEQRRLPASGATKPMAFKPQELTPNAWKEERDERLHEVARFRNNGWRESDVSLFKKISLRGFEPLLPPHWQVDFNNLPDSLFTKREIDASIKAHDENVNMTRDFRATKYLWSLIDLGAQVRDDILLNISPQHRIAKTFRHFLDWSVEDAGLKNKQGLLPLAVVCAAPNHVPAELVHREINKQLSKLAQEWKEVLGESQEHRMPPLYGIAVSHAVWAIVSYEPEGKSQAPEAQDDPDNFSTLMNTFSFVKPGQEVWVAFAFAIFAIHCREELEDVLIDGPVSALETPVSRASVDLDL